MNLFIDGAVVRVPETDQVVNAARRQIILSCRVDTGHVSAVVGFYFADCYKVMAFLGLRQAKICNLTVPARCHEPVASLIFEK